MRIVQINTCTYGSTGKIMRQLAQQAKEKGHECWCAVPKGRHNNEANSPYSEIIWIGNQFSEDSHLILGRLTGLQGLFSVIATKQFLIKLNRMKIDLLHIHNLHNSYINIPMLFEYIKRRQIRVIWTLHDCWAFTGHCPHFTLAACEKWKTKCYDCPSYRAYPQSYIDTSSLMWTWKRKWFSGVKDMTIITPSQWLADLVKESFLKVYPVKVINNGIDLQVFRPTESDFRERYGLEGKKLLLGVAFGWGERKGLDVFVELAKRLPEDYRIVLVGTDEKVDRQLPENIISIHRTQNQRELAEIYTSADVFVNPTREEVLGLVNIEANACGTPVITFRTGGSPECIDERCGAVVDCDDIDTLEKEILRICTVHPYRKDDCLKKASSFEQEKRFKEYLDLYESMTAERE